MGHLAHFNLPYLRSFHKCRSLVETGTADGNGVMAGLQAGFETIHSVEIMPRVAEAARLRFSEFSQVRIWEGASAVCLPEILAVLPPEPALFWLDAHFPGAHGHGQTYTAEDDAAKRLPLQDELQAIRAARPTARDVILIDDCRIYVPGPYGDGDAPQEVLEATAGVVERGPQALDFVRDLYGATHGFVIDFEHQGYGMLFPRLAPPGARA